MKDLSPQERETLLFALLDQMLDEQITPGQLLKRLRREVLGMNQTDYAALASISRRTLSSIETDRDQHTLDAFNRAFRPFGLAVGLLPRDRRMRRKLLAQGS